MQLLLDSGLEGVTRGRETVATSCFGMIKVNEMAGHGIEWILLDIKAWQVS